MQTIGKALPYAIGGLVGGTILKSIFKQPKVPTQPGPATRDEARDKISRDLEIARRRGGAADMVTGPYGAEAPSTAVGKPLLGD